VLLTPGLSVIIERSREVAAVFSTDEQLATTGHHAEDVCAFMFCLMTLAIRWLFNFLCPVTACHDRHTGITQDGAILSIAYDRVH